MATIYTSMNWHGCQPHDTKFIGFFFFIRSFHSHFFILGCSVVYSQSKILKLKNIILFCLWFWCKIETTRCARFLSSDKSLFHEAPSIKLLSKDRHHHGGPV